MRKANPQTTTVVAAFLLLVLILAVASCESTAEPEPAAPLEASGTVGAGGGTLSSEDGDLSITIPAGALAGDTEITIREAASPSQTRLGDFRANKTISMEPAGLEFLVPVTLSYETGLQVTNLAKAQNDFLKDGTVEDEFELALGILLGEDSSRVPDQKITYGIGDGSLTLRIELDYTGDVVIGRPIAKDTPSEGFDLSSLRFGITMLGQTFLLYEPFQPQLTVNMAHFDYMSSSNYRMDPPTLPMDWNGDTPAANPVDLGNGRMEYTVTPEYTATEEGDFDLDLDFSFDLTIPNPDILDLPDDLDPTFGSIEVEVESRPLAIRFAFCMEQPCFFEGFISTGMESHEGLSINYLNESDIDPDSLRVPWLYVTGTDGMQYYRLNRNADGSIFTTNLVGDLGETADFRGVIPVSHRDNGKIQRGLFVYGDMGGWRSNWFDDLDGDGTNHSGYGIQLLISGGNIHDAVTYGGEDQAFGYTFTNGTTVQTVQYYAPAQMFAGESTLNLFGQAFDGAEGGPTTAFVNPSTNGILVVMDGIPSQVWFHDRVDQYETGSMVTTVGSDPRQMRGSGSVIGVTNYGSNSVSILTWNGGAAVSNHGQIPVGAGPIGLDAMPLANGNVGFVCTSASENTYNYIEVTTGGSVVRNVLSYLPEYCDGAKYAVFLPGPKVYIVLSCASADIAFVETILEY